MQRTLQFVVGSGPEQAVPAAQDDEHWGVNNEHKHIGPKNGKIRAKDKNPTVEQVQQLPNRLRLEHWQQFDE
jgi:hypothetical protein